MRNAAIMKLRTMDRERRVPYTTASIVDGTAFNCGVLPPSVSVATAVARVTTLGQEGAHSRTRCTTDHCAAPSSALITTMYTTKKQKKEEEEEPPSMRG